MLALVVIIIGIVGFFVLAMRRAPLWQWAVGALVLGILTRLGWTADGATFGIFTDITGWVLALLPAVILGLLSITAIRRAVLAAPAYRLVKSILPRVSRTEQEALDAGTVPGDSTGTVVSAALIDGEMYQWELRFVNGLGAVSNWVDAYTDVTGIPLPTPQSMRLSASSQIFRVPQTGNALPATITLQVVRTGGLSAATTWTTSPTANLSRAFSPRFRVRRPLPGRGSDAGALQPGIAQLRRGAVGVGDQG